MWVAGRLEPEKRKIEDEKGDRRDVTGGESWLVKQKVGAGTFQNIMWIFTVLYDDSLSAEFNYDERQTRY